jgi:hypothetical protein
MKLSIDKILVNDQPLDHEKVARFAVIPAEKFPPIAVRFDGGYTIVQGRHRLAAAKLRNETTISAEVV